MIKLRKDQQIIFKDVTKALKKNSKVLLCANCGLGKTCIGLCIAKEAIKQGKRVAICCYSRNEIKTQWLEENYIHNIISPDQIQVIGDCDDKYCVTRATGEDIDQKAPITFFIPQSLRTNTSALGKIDLFICDEAHENLDISNEEGVLKEIIRSNSTSKTKILGLTGTGHELLQKDAFNINDKKVSILIYDMPFALKHKVVLPVEVITSYFMFNLSEKCYNNSGDLNNVGSKVVKSQACKNKKLETILKKYSFTQYLGKTLVIVPRGNDIWKETFKFINSKFPNQVVVKTSHQSNDDVQDSENRFRNNPNIKFMIVVDMCGTGWNYPALETIVDLTFTKNTKVLIQRMLRLCRLYKNKKPRYIYCADQRQESWKSQVLINECYELMTKEGILNHGRNKILFDKERSTEASLAQKDGEDASLGRIDQYFDGKIKVNTKYSETDTKMTICIQQTERWKRIITSCFSELSEMQRQKKITDPQPRIIEWNDYISDLGKKMPLNSDRAINLISEKAKKLFNISTTKMDFLIHMVTT